MVETLNADFSKRAFMDTGAMDWNSSPHPKVWLKRLDLSGGEYGRATSIVRYDRDSKFPVHDHPEGEEIFVLEGEFSDEHGNYPAGTYLLNPPGFHHAPFSRLGCVLFVKLRHYGGEKRDHVVIGTEGGKWRPGPFPGVEVLPLYEHPDHPETMALMQISGGAAIAEHACPGGAEVLVLKGVLKNGAESFYSTGVWLRLPHGEVFAPSSETGCTVYIKRGHLAQQEKSVLDSILQRYQRLKVVDT